MLQGSDLLGQRCQLQERNLLQHLALSSADRNHLAGNQAQLKWRLVSGYGMKKDLSTRDDLVLWLGPNMPTSCSQELYVGLMRWLVVAWKRWRPRSMTWTAAGRM